MAVRGEKKLHILHITLYCDETCVNEMTSAAANVCSLVITNRVHWT
jgi:hypothetical protein